MSDANHDTGLPDASGPERDPIEPGPEPDTTDAAEPDDVDSPIRADAPMVDEHGTVRE